MREVDFGRLFWRTVRLDMDPSARVYQPFGSINVGRLNSTALPKINLTNDGHNGRRGRTHVNTVCNNND